MDRPLLEESWFQAMALRYIQQSKRVAQRELLLPPPPLEGFDEAEAMEVDPRALCDAKIRKFRSDAYLDSECIRLWGDRLGVEVITNALCSFPIGEELWARSQGYAYIPLILQSNWQLLGGVDHIVIVRVNFETKVIEYYNPQGGRAENETRMIKGVEVPLNSFVQREGWQIQSCPVSHQTDWHSCGVFVCWFMKMRERVGSFEEFFQLMNNFYRSKLDHSERDLLPGSEEPDSENDD